MSQIMKAFMGVFLTLFMAVTGNSGSLYGSNECTGYAGTDC